MRQYALFEVRGRLLDAFDGRSGLFCINLMIEELAREILAVDNEAQKGNPLP